MEEVRDGFVFRCGSPALDFTATLGGRRKAEPHERLVAPKDLGRWFKAAGISPTVPQISEADLSAARRLREAIYALAVARAANDDLPASARHTLNRFAAAEPAAPQLDANGALKLSGDAAQLLSTIAQEAVRVLSDATPIRQCEGEGCAILFMDASRAGDRRWCSMTACGNRAKVAEFRRRKGKQ